MVVHIGLNSERGEVAISDEFRILQELLTQENDPAERREIIGCMLAQIHVRWSELFELIANEQNLQDMLLMLAELDEIFETQKIQLTKIPTTAFA